MVGASVLTATLWAMIVVAMLLFVSGCKPNIYYDAGICIDVVDRWSACGHYKLDVEWRRDEKDR